MSAEDLEVARRFLGTLASAAQTGNREALVPLLAADVVWEMPQRDLHGVGAVRDEATWVAPPDDLEISFDEPELTDLGEGRIVAETRETYRMKGSGDFAYVRAFRIELTIRDRRIARYRRGPSPGARAEGSDMNAAQRPSSSVTT